MDRKNPFRVGDTVYLPEQYDSRVPYLFSDVPYKITEMTSRDLRHSLEVNGERIYTRIEPLILLYFGESDFPKIPFNAYFFAHYTNE